MEKTKQCDECIHFNVCKNIQEYSGCITEVNKVVTRYDPVTISFIDVRVNCLNFKPNEYANGVIKR